jgi:hypothetical protein
VSSVQCPMSCVECRVQCVVGVPRQMQHRPGSPTGLAATQGPKVGSESERESRTWDGPRSQVLHWVRRRCLKVTESWGLPNCSGRTRRVWMSNSEAVTTVRTMYSVPLAGRDVLSCLSWPASRFPLWCLRLATACCTSPPPSIYASPMVHPYLPYWLYTSSHGILHTYTQVMAPCVMFTRSDLRRCATRLV